MTTVTICAMLGVHARLWALIIHPASQTKELGLGHGLLHVQGALPASTELGAKPALDVA